MPDSNDQLVTSLYLRLITTHSFESSVFTSKTTGRWPVDQDWWTLLYRFSIFQLFYQNANCLLFIHVHVHCPVCSSSHSFIHSSYKRSRSEPQPWELHVLLTEVTERTTAQSFTHSFISSFTPIDAYTLFMYLFIWPVCSCLFVSIESRSNHQRSYMTLTL